MNIQRGFSRQEIAARVAHAQRWMAQTHTDAMLFTTAPELYYFANFHTPFWQSPTRPWFLVIPQQSDPVAVVPEIGAERMRESGLTNLRTWPSPRPADEGISELTETLRECLSKRGKIGILKGAETHLRMPLADFERLAAGLAAEFIDATPLVQSLRMTKSEAEIDKNRRACQAGSSGFAAASMLFAAGMREAQAFRILKAESLRAGADDAPYVTGGAAPGGKSDIIAPPSERALQAGDILNLDLGCTWDGYHSDFNRNFSVGPADAETAQMYRALWRATEAGIAAARPGVSCADVFRAIAGSLEQDGAQAGTVGRMGHGVGMQLTEWPSLAAWDDTRLAAGMVLAIEPTAMFPSGRAMTHEENIVVREDGAELLSKRTAPEIPEI